MFAFAGALVGLWSFQPGLVTAKGLQGRIVRLKVGLGAMAVIAWGIVITGTHVLPDVCGMTAAPDNARADRVAAQATGVGVGLLAFMITWLIGARFTDQIWGPPSSAAIALVTPVFVGIAVSVVAARQLVRRQASEVR